MFPTNENRCSIFFVTDAMIGAYRVYIFYIEIGLIFDGKFKFNYFFSGFLPN